MSNEDYVDLNNVRCLVTTRLPGGVRACTYHDEDGNEFLVVNDFCCPRAKREAADHELRHIRRGETFDPAYREYQ